VEEEKQSPEGKLEGGGEKTRVGGGSELLGISSGPNGALMIPRGEPPKREKEEPSRETERTHNNTEEIERIFSCLLGDDRRGRAEKESAREA